jgi:predicted membrane protein
MSFTGKKEEFAEFGMIRVAGHTIVLPEEKIMNESNNCDNQASKQKSRFSNGGIYVSHGNSRIAIGIIILLVGILILLGNLGVFYYGGNIGQFWPVILIGIGLARIFDAPKSQGKFLGAVITGVGAIILMSKLNFLPWDLSRLLWPFLLICAGVAVLIRGVGGRCKWDNPFPFNNDASKFSDNTNNVLNADVIFGGVNRRIQAQDFQGGKATAVFGSVEIDLRGSATTREEIHIEANAIFGGVVLTVPDAWDVIVRGTGVLGGYEDKTHPILATAGVKQVRLIVEGSAVLGGVEVKN